MCVDCTEMHKSIMVPHTILPIDKTKHAGIKKVLDSSDRSQVCQTHHDKLVTFYCKTCNVTYCAKCEYHASHDTETIPTAARYVRKHLQQYIAAQSPVVAQIRDRIADYSRFQTELVSQLESSRKTLYNFSGLLADSIRQKARAVDEELKQLFTAQKRDSFIIIKQLEDEEAVGKSFINDILASLNYGSTVQLVRSMSGFDKRYGDIVTLPPHLLDPAMKPMFQFKPSSDTKPITEFVIGSICGHQPVTQGQTKLRDQASWDERYYKRQSKSDQSSWNDSYFGRQNKSK
ncbi:uncharacterized protein LOC110449105 [Mizuhopecten yessoensis]|uniref:uncharacterized protein LOC110449105 n=1 Tax=Mizuhopecten yessoensis TaxID=6573 RepID=UPI000B45EB93|nr:uncharacterized protein LOC110449105 [Mizuhopecten yessoensis]